MDDAFKWLMIAFAVMIASISAGEAFSEHAKYGAQKACYEAHQTNCEKIN